MEKHIETAIRNRTLQQVLLRSYIGDAPAHITYGELGAIAVLLSRQYPAGPEDLPIDDGLKAASILCDDSVADVVADAMRGLAEDVLGPTITIVMRSQDDVFFDQVRNLAGTAASAIEEAEQYAGDIKDPALRERALRFLDNAF